MKKNILRRYCCAIALGTSVRIGAAQVQVTQDEFPKKPGLHALQGIDIIPEPQIAVTTGGDIVINSSTAIYADPKLQDPSPVNSLQEGLTELIQAEIKISGSRPSKNGIELKLVPESGLRDIPNGNAKKEGYILEVGPSKITISAAYPAGLFYGVQTLLQLAEQGEAHVRGLKIADWPEMEFRGIHVDLWFHQDRPWYYEYLFKQLARYKINYAVFEFEDKFFYAKHPVLSAPGAMTNDQVQRMVAEAKKYFIEIIPLVQTLGHVAYIGKHAEFANLRELPVSNYELCPLKEGTLPLIQDMLEETIDAVRPSKYVHIGGDEAYELGKGTECLEKWGDNAAVESYKLWLNFVCNYLKKQEKTAIVWDDMFLRHFSPADMANLPDNLIYMRWQYGNGKIDERNRKILNLGYPVWIATAAQTMTPIYPDQKLRVFNNANLIPAAASLGMKGVLNTAWEDPGTHPETYWIGFLCSAEYSWSSNKPATDEFMNKFFKLFYGKDQHDLDKVYSLLSEKGFLRAESSWTRDFSALDLPPLPDNEFRADTVWAGKNSKIVAQAREMLPRYSEAVEIISKNLAANTKNKYNLEVLLLSARTLLHFTELVLSINEINDNLLAADADHKKGDDQSAMNHYQHAGRIIEDLRYEKSRLFDETVRVWGKSVFPKDFSHIPGGREKFVHQIDLSNYIGNRTMDLDYNFEVEESLGLFGYQQKLYRVMQSILRNYRWE